MFRLERFTILSFLTMIVSITAFAQDSLELSAQSFLISYAQKYPLLSLLIMIMGSARLILKPIFAIAHSIAGFTVTDKDNKIIEKIEKSKILKGIFFISDYLFSAKALNPSKMAEYRAKKLK